MKGRQCIYSMKLKETTAAAPRVVDVARTAASASVKGGEGLRCGRRRRWARHLGESHSQAGRGGLRGLHRLRSPRPEAVAGAAPSRAAGQAPAGLAVQSLGSAGSADDPVPATPPVPPVTGRHGAARAPRRDRPRDRADATFDLLALARRSRHRSLKAPFRANAGRRLFHQREHDHDYQHHRTRSRRH